MKLTAPLLLALTLATVGLAAAAAPTIQERRAMLVTHVDGAIGADAKARIQPLVDDAQNRIVGAMHAAGAQQKSPLEILSFGQKMTLRRARREHTDPDLNLSAEQRTEIDAYISAVAAAVAPIVHDDGTKIDLLLTPQQRTAIDALRLETRDALRAMPAAPAGMPDLAAALIGTRLTDAGSFVVLVEIDLNAVAAALR